MLLLLFNQAAVAAQPGTSIPGTGGWGAGLHGPIRGQPTPLSRVKRRLSEREKKPAPEPIVLVEPVPVVPVVQPDPLPDLIAAILDFQRAQAAQHARMLEQDDEEVMLLVA